MIRLIIVVEGQSEEVFVKNILKPHLDALKIYTSVAIVGKLIALKRGHRDRGGGHFRHWRNDLRDILQNDSSPDLRVTTLFDLYGLPSDFPGLDEHGADTDTKRRCQNLEAALGREFEDRRFIPYIQRHEFEALILASLPALYDLFDAEDDLAGLAALKDEVGIIAPEDVNDGRETAPSKRLSAHVPGFRKTLHGPLAAEDTGLAVLRKRCPRFATWVRTLEDLSTSTDPLRAEPMLLIKDRVHCE